jgi:hypothetical protein
MIFRKRSRQNQVECEPRPRPFPPVDVQVNAQLVSGVVDKLQAYFHPSPAWEMTREGTTLSQEQLELITAAFMVGMFDGSLRSDVDQSLNAMTDRISWDEALHFGNFGYFTRKNVNSEVAPGLERIYQRVADSFCEANRTCVEKSFESDET